MNITFEQPIDQLSWHPSPFTDLFRSYILNLYFDILVKIFEKELNAVWNVSSCGDLSPPWTTLIRMKSDRLAGLRFSDSIKRFILTSESCSGFTGRIFDKGVVD